MDAQNREADRWLRQAAYDLKAAEWCQQGGFFATASFSAQQSAAKALRAFLFIRKEDARETRSVADLLERAITYDERFKKLVDKCSRLDLYYKTSRFPDAIPGSIPADMITARDSTESINSASDILTLVEEARKANLPEVM